MSHIHVQNKIYDYLSVKIDAKCRWYYSGVLL